MSVLERQYEKSPSIVGRAIEDQTILVPIRNNVGDLQDIYVLNEVGGFIWNSIEGKVKGDEIAARIMEEFDVSIKEAQRDLSTFLQQLEQIGAIKSS